VTFLLLAYVFNDKHIDNYVSELKTLTKMKYSQTIKAGLIVVVMSLITWMMIYGAVTA